MNRNSEEKQGIIERAASAAREIGAPISQSIGRIYSNVRKGIDEVENLLEGEQTDAGEEDGSEKRSVMEKAADTARSLSAPITQSLDRIYQKVRGTGDDPNELGEEDVTAYWQPEAEEDSPGFLERASSAARTISAPIGQSLEKIYSTVVKNPPEPEGTYIKEISVNGDLTRIKAVDQESETVYEILTDFLLDEGYQKGQQLAKEDLEKLNGYHGYSAAYLKCLRKLAVSDYSVREIRELLAECRNVTDQQRQDILDKLITYGFLNDEVLTSYRFDYDQSRLVGKKKIAYQLEKRGVDRSLIEKELEAIDPQAEIERGLQKAAVLLKSLRNRSEKETLALLRRKLAASGYDSESIDEIITRLDWHQDDEEERKSLAAALEKYARSAAHRYEKKVLDSKIIRYLMSKGFRRETIMEVMQQQEAENED
ncbi:MAG: RecX family transcriptional regulator [Erysipelotrichaceae bacterium]|nr:RecX family transcriptional regulator [Erysipelotrichaceae bacterium]